MKRKTNYCIVILLITLSTGNMVFSQKLEANNPLPKEYAGSLKQLNLNENIKVWESKFLISSSTHNAAATVGLVGIAFIRMAKTVMQQLETDIATKLPPETDTLLLKNCALNAFSKKITQKGDDLESPNDYKFNLIIIDHGFHWATSSALGVYIRVKAEVLSSEGEVLWEQLYYMDKNEKKIPHNRKSLNVKRGVEGLLLDYDTNPDLLKETYDQIFTMLAAKL